MCQRQNTGRLVPLRPSNDNLARSAARVMASNRSEPRLGILAIVLERVESVRLDFVADGVLKIQGQR